MLVKNESSIGYFKKVDIGFFKDSVYVRKFDDLGICFYERLYSSWSEAYEKFNKLKMKLIRS